jgi:hypothetical protein
MSRRAFIIGLLAVALIAAVTPYNDFDKGNTFFTGNHFPAGAVAILLVLTLGVNVLVKLVRRAAALRQAELMLVWCMMIVSCTVPASGLMRYWFSICASPAYYAARPDLPFEQHVLKEVPPHLVLTTDPKSVAAKKFFEGTPSGDRVRIPWGPWLRPMLAWAGFVVCFYLATLFATAILRKQWVESERLIFPLARVPLEFTEDAGGASFLPSMVRSRPFIVGAAVTLVFAFIRCAPVLTGAEQGWRPELPIQSVLWGTPLQHMDMWSGFIYPIAIGFAFLVPSDISLSIWLFFLFTRLELQGSHWIGRPIQGGTWGPFMTWQQAGAYVVFVAMMLWAARRHLAAVARKALGLDGSVDDSEEPVGYRVAFWGLLVSFLGMAVWLAVHKMNFLVAVAYLALVMVLALGLARLVAQGGVFFVQQVWQPPPLLHSITGGRAFGAASAVVAEMQSAIFLFDAREILSGHAVNAFRLASVFKKHRRLFLPALLAALVVSVVVCAWATLYVYYDVGGYNIANPWGTRSHAISTFTRAHRMIAQPGQTADAHYGPMIAGAAIMFTVTFMRARFYWWPVHSLGFLIASTYPAHTYYFSFFLGWLAKVLTLKFAGGGMLRTMRSFFLGVIIAESFAIAVSTVLGLAGVKLGFIFLPS